jgi:hypothetical protein
LQVEHLHLRPAVREGKTAKYRRECGKNFLKRTDPYHRRQYIIHSSILPGARLCGKNICQGENMIRKGLASISILILTILAACGPAAAPTLSVTDIQNTAFPLVMTQYALTQAAIPTDTPVPTEQPTLAPLLTPLPTFALETPISAPIVNPNATATPDCNQPIPSKTKGTTVQIKLVNKSGGSVNLSLGMNEANNQGECGVYSFGLRDKESVIVTILSGCYWGYGYVTGKKPSTSRVGNICLTDTSQTRGLTIGAETIGFD